MTNRSTQKTIVYTALVLIAAFAMKYHYSTAGVNGLRWILAPTAAIVELVSGMEFRFESYAGYLSEDRTYLIAASCSGVNFLIIAFVMLNLLFLLRSRDNGLKWQFLPISLFAAYFVTVITNSARIITSLTTRGMELGSGLFDAEELHRIEGIVIYFGALLLVYAIFDIVCYRSETGGAVWRNRVIPLMVPLGVYYAATLGIPIAGGALGDPSFREHSLFVLLLPGLLVLGFLLFLPGRGRTKMD